ncbi:unnamed protein product [Coregonus sp. 'balchen']|nr:unnamed protein product [Coregonus sp. 'balchen']
MPGSKETVKVSNEVMSSDQDEGPSVDVELEHLNEEMVSRKVKDKTLTGEQTKERKGHEVFHSPQCHSMNIGRKTHCCQQVVDNVVLLVLFPIPQGSLLKEANVPKYAPYVGKVFLKQKI